MRKGLMVIAFFFLLDFLFLEHIFLLCAKYCSGFILEQHVCHILTYQCFIIWPLVLKKKRKENE